LPGLETNRGACRDVEAVSVGPLALEFQRVVRLVEMVVRAYLDRPVARVRNLQFHCLPALVQRDVARGRLDLAGNHGMGWCTVTSLVPSGKVASIWISGIISGTPSITSARLRSVAPQLMSSCTPRPSRAPSMSAALMKATASG